jgi:nucleoside 2-deoxyribosyltransferase
MITTLYVAAPFPYRSTAQRVMRRLEAAGFAVTSTWLKEHDTSDEASARVCLADVHRADALVLLNPLGFEAMGTGGRHVEFGYALALGRPCLVVGRRSNMFHHLSSSVTVCRLETLLDALRTLNQNQKGLPIRG